MKKEKKKTSIISKRRKYKIINTFSSKYNKKKKKKTCMSEMTYIYIYVQNIYCLFLGIKFVFVLLFIQIHMLT
jgi:hypothetical protein